jgi:hypothetical protein
MQPAGSDERKNPMGKRTAVCSGVCGHGRWNASRAEVKSGRQPHINKSVEQSFDAINFRRRKQIADDSKKLLTLVITPEAELDLGSDKGSRASRPQGGDVIEKPACNFKVGM